MSSHALICSLLVLVCVVWSQELTNEMRYNEKSDIWAVGCLLYELAALRCVFASSLAVPIQLREPPPLQAPL